MTAAMATGAHSVPTASWEGNKSTASGTLTTVMTIITSSLLSYSRVRRHLQQRLPYCRRPNTARKIQWNQLNLRIPGVERIRSPLSLIGTTNSSKGRREACRICSQPVSPPKVNNIPSSPPSRLLTKRSVPVYLANRSGLADARASHSQAPAANARHWYYRHAAIDDEEAPQNARHRS